MASHPGEKRPKERLQRPPPLPRPRTDVVVPQGLVVAGASLGGGPGSLGPLSSAKADRPAPRNSPAMSSFKNLGGISGRKK